MIYSINENKAVVSGVKKGLHKDENKFVFEALICYKDELKEIHIIVDKDIYNELKNVKDKVPFVAVIYNNNNIITCESLEVIADEDDIIEEDDEEFEEFKEKIDEIMSLDDKDFETLCNGIFNDIQSVKNYKERQELTEMLHELKEARRLHKLMKGVKH